MISFNRRHMAGPETKPATPGSQSDSLSMLGTQLQDIHEPPHDKTNKMAIAPSEDTDQPVHPPRLISLRCPHEETLGPHTHWVLRRFWSDWRMPRLIWVFAGHKGHFVGFVMRWLTFRKCILIFASGLRNKPHFWRPCSLALWLQSQGSLVRAPVLPRTGYTCNLRRISHEIIYMVFLLFPLTQERQFLVISDSICTLDNFVLVNCLEGLSLSARRSGLGRSFNCIPGIHRPEWASQIYCYMRGIVVTLSRSLHQFLWCWGGATSSSHTNLPTLTHALQYQTEWNLNIICLHVAETNSGQFRGMKWCIPGMHLNVRSPVLEATHGHYMTEILSQRFAR